MKKARIIIVVTVLCAAVSLFALPASRAKDTKPSAKDVTFTKDVAPIFFKNCAECHRPGEAAPFSALSYKDARPWARSIREQVVSHEMPPWRADPPRALPWVLGAARSGEQTRPASCIIGSAPPQTR